DANGNLTGLQITNPGTDYTAPPVFTLFGGGVGNTGNITGTASLVANTSGGLTKLGGGTMKVTRISTHTGPTKISGGSLAVVSGVIDQTSKLIMDGGTLDTQGSSLTLTSTTLQATGTGGSVIDLRNSSTVHFANSSGETWGPSMPGSILLSIN